MERPASRNHLEAFSADTTDIVASANRYAAAEATLNLAKDFVQQSKHEKNICINVLWCETPHQWQLMLDDFKPVSEVRTRQI